MRKHFHGQRKGDLSTQLTRLLSRESTRLEDMTRLDKQISGLGQRLSIAFPDCISRLPGSKRRRALNSSCVIYRRAVRQCFVEALASTASGTYTVGLLCPKKISNRQQSLGAPLSLSTQRRGHRNFCSYDIQAA